MVYSRFPPLALVLVALASFSTNWAKAQAPDSLSFQGFITDTGGAPINNAGVSMTFKLYEGSSEIWSETQPSVTVSNGVFNVLLGSVTPLDTVAFHRALDLGITVGTDSEISPRTPLAAAAFAKALPGFYTVFRTEAPWSSYNLVGGSAVNGVGSGVTGATISGGGSILGSTPYPNQVLGNFGTVGGGSNNTASGSYAAVGGGSANTAGQSAVVSGGYNNLAGGDKAAVGGGQQNTAGGSYATTGGGYSNAADGDYATISGGQENAANGSFSTVPGGIGNRAANFSFAAGSKAKASYAGTFVWNDRSVKSGNDSLVSTAENQFLARASGGFTFYTKSDNSTGAVLASNTGAWASVSDVHAKTGFVDTEPTLVLERLSRVPIRTWRYKGQDESITHMGPTSQDFYEAFGLGIDDKHIVTVDADGVALAAIQGLYELVQDQQREIERMQAVLVEAGLE